MFAWNDKPTRLELIHIFLQFLLRKYSGYYYNIIHVCPPASRRRSSLHCRRSRTTSVNSNRCFCVYSNSYTALHNESKFVQINRVPLTGGICWPRTFLSYFSIPLLNDRKRQNENSIFSFRFFHLRGHWPSARGFAEFIKNSQKKKDKNDKKICEWKNRLNRRKMFYLRADAGHAFLRFWGFSSFLFRTEKGNRTTTTTTKTDGRKNTKHKPLTNTAYSYCTAFLSSSQLSTRDILDELRHFDSRRNKNKKLRSRSRERRIKENTK